MFFDQYVYVLEGEDSNTGDEESQATQVCQSQSHFLFQDLFWKFFKIYSTLNSCKSIGQLVILDIVELLLKKGINFLNPSLDKERKSVLGNDFLILFQHNIDDICMEFLPYVAEL